MVRRIPKTVLRSHDYRTFIEERLERGDRKRLADHIGRTNGWVSSMLNREPKDPDQIRRVNPGMADAIADFLHLDDRDRSYFRALVELEEGDSALAGERARAILRADALLSTPEEQVTRLFELMDAGWYLGAVLELAKCAGFQPNPRWISSCMHPKVTVTQASRALAMLVSAGLLREDGSADPDSHLSAIMTSLDLPKGQLTKTTWKLYQEGLRIASSADQYYQNERHVGVGILSLSEERFDEVRSMMRQTFYEAAAEALHDERPPNRLYQFVVALHPVSDYTDSLAVELSPESDDE